ncbi:MAG: UDP-N-acetylmuramate dehydrogenase [Clostridia bacterium]|nr:UDP-N-acetylmuramate dehydrogenase [Clostridia bacterium]
MSDFSRFASVLLNVPARDFTTYRVGGQADCIVSPYSEEDFLSVLKIFYYNNTPYRTIGKGSKLLVSDKGVRGVLLSTKNLSSVVVDGNTLYALAGASVGKILSASVQNGLSGLEFLAGIPASLGGLICLNGGAFSHTISDNLASLSVFSNGQLRQFVPNKNSFGYRTSPIKNTDTVISASFKLTKTSPKIVSDNIKNYLIKRLSQPKGNSCGSVFKNPDGCFAGEIIDRCNLKGKCIGGARVSDKHANFIIADASATATSVYELIRFIKTTVKDKFNISLEEEVIFLGDFDDSYSRLSHPYDL